MIIAIPVQIANPQVVAKIERLSRITGLGKTAAVEAALDRMLADGGTPWAGFDAVIAQLHRRPPRPDTFDAIEYDEAGLPK